MELASDSVETYAPPPPAALRHAGFMHDPDVAVAALQAPAGARLLVVDAHGGSEAAFAHLAADPTEIRVAALVHTDQVDALVALQQAAYSVLERAAALKLLGLLRASRADRAQLYARLQHRLRRGPRTFWADNPEAVTGGIYNASAEAGLGRLLRNLLSEHLTSDDFRTLLYGSQEARLAVFDGRIATSPFWKRALRLCAVRGRVAAPEDQAVDAFSHGDPMDALRSMVTVGLWGSPLWARAFCNDAGLLATLPAYLQPAGFRQMAGRVDRVVGRVERFEHALAEARSLDGVDLGALPDHLDADRFRQVLSEVASKLNPGCRVSYTRVAADDPPAPPGLRRDLEAETRLAALDRAPMTGARRVLVAEADPVLVRGQPRESR